MSQWEKLLEKLKRLSPELRFEELKKILEHYGYKMDSPRSGTSNYYFRKESRFVINIPKHKPIKKVYIILVRDAVEKEEQ